MKALFVATAAAMLLVAAPASAGPTHTLSGKQLVVNEEQGVYKMRGSLIGRWNTTSFEEVETTPYYHGRGTELFKGCLDRRHDRSCKGDPSGTLSFTFDFWALFASEDPSSLVWGSCWHPVASGTGDFAGAQGVVVMVDTPAKNGSKTAYIGNVTLKGKGAKGAHHSRARAARAGCHQCRRPPLPSVDEVGGAIRGFRCPHARRSGARSGAASPARCWSTSTSRPRWR